MSEKGVLSKSIASNISEAIIEKLGGTGYAPTEWSKNINLLGIASADIEEALASITEDASSSDKGLLSLSIASDMGAILNKKYNTSRGFKPSEVSSAVSALIPLPEKTTSSAPIVTFFDGADDVPLKSCEVALSASLDGHSSVDVVGTGKNLFTDENRENGYLNIDGDLVSASGWYVTDYIEIVPSTEYTFTSGSSAAASPRTILYDKSKTMVQAINTGNRTFTTPTTAYYIRISYRSTDTDIQLEVGSTATTYTEYVAPTTHTANLGRTIYGGTADIVNGTCEPINLVSLNRSPAHSKINYGVTVNTQTDNTLNMTTTGVSYACERLFYSLPKGTYTAKHTSTSSDDFSAKIAIYKYPFSTVIANSFASGVEKTFTLTEDTDIDIRLFASGNSDTAIRTVEFTDFRIEKGSTVHDYSPYFEPFTFDGQEINSRLGANTMWSDGDMSVVYRADLDLYETPGTLSDTNDTETEGNEEQEVNE